MPSLVAWVESLGWMLIHSVWLIALIVGFAAVGLALIPRRSANARYLFGGVALLLSLSTLPAVLVWGVTRSTTPEEFGTLARASNLAVRDGDVADLDGAGETIGGDAEPELQGEPVQLEARPLRNPNGRLPMDVDLPSAARARATPPMELTVWKQVETRLRPHLALLVSGWLAGVCLLSVRPLIGWHSVRRLQRVGLSEVPDSLQEMLSRLARRLGVRRAVKLFQSNLVQIPCVVGALKPVILLPASAIVGLSPKQLEALLAHELAHIRRHDFAVNVVPMLVETLLFYHPAIWWLSRRVRQEREHCCDDLAISVCGDVASYARMLVSVEGLRGRGLHTSVAANGGSLVERIRRLVPIAHEQPRSPWLPGIFALGTLLVLAGSWQWTAGRAFNLPKEVAAVEQNKAERKLPTNGRVEDLPPKELDGPRWGRSSHGYNVAATGTSVAADPEGARSMTSTPDGNPQSNSAAATEGPRRESQEAPLPKSKEARSLFKKWQDGSRANGNVPGGAVGPLVRVMRNFIKNNPTHEAAPKFGELLKRVDVTRDWSPADAIKLLDEVCEIYPSLPEWVQSENRFRLGGDVVVGKPLPEALKNAPWGEARPNGLRAAWMLEPRAKEHRLNTPLKSRLLFHNSGKNAVVFRALTWNQSGVHKARDAKGAAVNVNSTYWTTIPMVFALRLAPGEFHEVVAAGIGVGANMDDEDWRDARSQVRVGAWIEAKAGDEITFLPAAIDCNGRDAGVPEGEVRVTAENWWPKFIADRLSLDAPLPADANERARLLTRATRDLFSGDPTEAELTAFKNDATPGALDALAKRLSQRAGIESFSGSLTSGPTKFNVLPVDPDAAKKPRTAKGPGQYPLGGNATFVVTRRPMGERIVNEARITFAPTDATTPAPREPHVVALPDDYDSWSAAWMRGGTVLWMRSREAIHEIDVTDPAKIVESDPDIGDVPQAIKAALAPPASEPVAEPPSKANSTTSKKPMTTAAAGSGQPGSDNQSAAATSREKPELSAARLLKRLEGLWELVTLHQPQGNRDLPDSDQLSYRFAGDTFQQIRRGDAGPPGLVELDTTVEPPVLRLRFRNADGSISLGELKGPIEFRSDDEFWLALPDTSVRPSREAVLAGQPRVVWKLKRVSE